MERLGLLEPKDPVAYPKLPVRPAGARRPVYRVVEEPKVAGSEPKRG